MRKYFVLTVTSVCMLVFIGCSSPNVVAAGHVFETANITRITFFCVPNHTNGIDVPAEDLDAISAWIGTFAIDKEAGDILDPGTNTFSLRIEYSDGTTIESGLNTTTIDGIHYYMKYETPPQCFDALFAD